MSGVTYTDVAPPTDVTLSYRVVAVDPSGNESVASNVDTAYVDATAPDAPANLVATVDGADEDLAWDAVTDLDAI